MRLRRLYTGPQGTAIDAVQAYLNADAAIVGAAGFTTVGTWTGMLNVKGQFSYSSGAYTPTSSPFGWYEFFFRVYVTNVGSAPTDVSIRVQGATLGTIAGYDGTTNFQEAPAFVTLPPGDHADSLHHQRHCSGRPRHHHLPSAI